MTELSVQPGRPIEARCGRTAPHGGHWAHAIGRPCAGNVNIVTAVTAPCFCQLPESRHPAPDVPPGLTDADMVGAVDLERYTR